ncbi:MAG: flagellar biosynthesis protein FlhF [Treponema sp.]|jgi:flagellar biosynthesis protein FlhF|nr:flagellar biosynthesis protein FlhF [Treponema sp.]
MLTYVEQGRNLDECFKKIRRRFGDKKVQVLEQRFVTEGGLFGLFPRELLEVKYCLLSDGRNNPFSAMAGSRSSPAPYQDYTGALSTGAGSGLMPPGIPANSSTVTATGKSVRGTDEDEKRKILASAGKDPAILQVLSEVRDIKEILDTANASQKDGEHPSLQRLAGVLKGNDFSPAFINSILERARKELSLEILDNYEELQDRALEWIGERISIHEEGQFHRRPRLLVLVGPTGVGKTSTIAKLAAFYGTDRAGRKPKTIKIITIDAFKVGARAQIETFGNYMGISVEMVDNYEDLRKAVALGSAGADMILIDTIGKSPRDSKKLGEMHQILSALGPHAEVHLVIAATTKASDIEIILQQFEPFNILAVIITKLDETYRLGNVISVLADKGKSISYITDGQKVPRDIQIAHALRFLSCLDDFTVNREKLEKRFPCDESKMIRWR